MQLIRRICPGEVITEAGQYDIPMDYYHTQDVCDGPSVSSTGLRKILLESPADYWAYSDLNPKRFEAEEVDAFTYGRAAHALLLGDDDFRARFAVVPDDAPPKPTQAQIRAAAEGRMSASAEERFSFWGPFAKENEGKTFLSEKELDDIGHIREALRANALVQVLMDGQSEQSLIWKDKTGIWLKSRLDMLSGTGDLADLKSTSQKDPRLLYRDIRIHGYDMQLGLATMALENVLDVPFTPEVYEGQRAAVLLFVYKKPPFHVMPVEVTYDALHWARLKCRQAIDTMARCLDTGIWPGPLEGIGQYTADYEVTELAERQRNGKLPVSV